MNRFDTDSIDNWLATGSFLPKEPARVQHIHDLEPSISSLLDAEDAIPMPDLDPETELRLLIGDNEGITVLDLTYTPARVYAPQIPAVA